jgi:putative ABC transport system permease protein
VSSGFGTPWRDDRGLSISFQFAAQGAKRADGQDFRAKFRVVSPGFFETFGVPLQQGRDFNDADKKGSERVVISRSLARMLYPGQDAVNSKTLPKSAAKHASPHLKLPGCSGHACLGYRRISSRRT